MNNQSTEIAFILDRSGSMASMHHAAITSFNEFLAGQQALTDDQGQPIPATFSLILFDDHYDIIHHRAAIATVPPLSHATYQPRGSTALYDAIARTIDSLGQTFAVLPAEQRPGKVIIAILTDGQENASREFTLRDINQRIRHQTDTYQWEFLFLGANQDAIATAAAMGISAANSATYQADAEDLAAANQAISGKMKSLRKLQADVALDEEEQFILHESMTETFEKQKAKK
jgi:hypothetical protein